MFFLGGDGVCCATEREGFQTLPELRSKAGDNLRSLEGDLLSKSNAVALENNGFASTICKNDCCGCRTGLAEVDANLFDTPANFSAQPHTNIARVFVLRLNSGKQRL